MIVRESPKAAARREPQNWPPKSPHDALLSSPGARKRYERERARNSTSPSPTKRRPLSRAQLQDEEDDEETLQLQLEAIEARLKLKKLQQAKARQAAEDGVGIRASSANGVTASSRPGTAASARRVDLPRPDSVDVPMSPVRNRRRVEEQKSPVRVLLGIDKGLKAQDVSLKRASSFHARSNARDASRPSSRTNAAPEPPRKSFSERMAEARSSEKERQEKQTRIENSRSRGFGFRDTGSLGDALSVTSSRAASAVSGTGNARTARERTEMPPPLTKGPSLPRSQSIGDLHKSGLRPVSNLSSRSDVSHAESTSTSSSHTSSGTTSSKTSIDNADAPSLFESFSGLHLNKRHIAHNTLTRTLDSKTIYTIPQLLKAVKSPNYEPPDVENDFVVVGVIASQSAPLATKTAQHTAKSESDTGSAGKFMVIRLTDLKWELDLYLFDTGFSRFYKLTTGTLVAILNPDIMPPRHKDTGKFSLKLTSSDDTVLEIGVARDLRYCSALRKDGKECGQWIDARKTEFCDFHIELQVEKSRRGRMEVNTMTGFGKGRGQSGGGRQGKTKDDGLLRHGRYHDSFLHETMYIAPGAGAAARLLDDDVAFEKGASRAELHRKRLAEMEKERELAKKLGEMGRGAGSDYMKAKGAKKEPLPQSSDNEPLSTSESATGLSAAAKVLLGKKAQDVSLSPVKRKRTISNKPQEPMGWGGAFKRGLLLDQKREASPSKKKARFMLEEKGIREPGRDSLGGLDVGLVAAMDEDDEDDGLDII